MTLDQIKTIAETFHAGQPPLKSPAYTLWLQAISSFVRFVEEDNDSIDSEAVERLCMTGSAKDDTSA